MIDEMTIEGGFADPIGNAADDGFENAPPEPAIPDAALEDDGNHGVMNPNQPGGAEFEQAPGEGPADDADEVPADDATDEPEGNAEQPPEDGAEEQSEEDDAPDPADEGAQDPAPQDPAPQDPAPQDPSNGGEAPPTTPAPEGGMPTPPGPELEFGNSTPPQAPDMTDNPGTDRDDAGSARPESTGERPDLGAGLAAAVQPQIAAQPATGDPGASRRGGRSESGVDGAMGPVAVQAQSESEGIVESVTDFVAEAARATVEFTKDVVDEVADTVVDAAEGAVDAASSVVDKLSDSTDDSATKPSSGAEG